MAREGFCWGLIGWEGGGKGERGGEVRGGGGGRGKGERGKGKGGGERKRGREEAVFL